MFWKRKHDAQYEMLGYQIFQGALNPDALRKAVDAIKEEAIPHQGPLRRHPTGTYEPHRFVGPHISNQLLQPHWEEHLPRTSAALLDLLCSPELSRCLNQLDGHNAYSIHQIILFFVGPMMGTHIDGWYLDTVPQGYLHTVWIPLEPLTTFNGPVYVYPTRRGRFVDADELGLHGLFDSPDDEAITKYSAYCEANLERCRRLQPAVVTPQLEPGDFVVWTSLTPHGSFPRQAGTSRLSMQVLVRPSSYPWGHVQDILVDKKPKHDMGKQIRPGWRAL
jgi:hypothetical protein